MIKYLNEKQASEKLLEIYRAHLRAQKTLTEFLRSGRLLG